MAWYRCLVVGEDFPLMVEGGITMMGFVVTRFVEASTTEEAGGKAVDSLRNEPSLTIPEDRAGRERARAFVEEVEEVAAPGTASGLAFFPMEER